MITIQQTNITSGEIINHKLTHVDREASVLEACKLMRKSGTTELLVTEEAQGILLPLGILNANDIVTHVIAAELDPAVLTTGDIALWEIAAPETADDGDLRQRPSQKSNCETVAILDGDGELVGTVRLDEVMEHSLPYQVRL